MAPLHHRRALALALAAAACLALAASSAAAAAIDAGAATPTPRAHHRRARARAAKPFFGHLLRTRYPPEAQSWRATSPGAPVFAHLARGDVPAALAGRNATAANDAPIPRSFSWCDVGGASLCAPSWQQHNAALAPPGARYCGSCFLHATLSALQDRIKGMRHLQALSSSSSSSSSPSPSSSPAAAAATSSSSSSSSATSSRSRPSSRSPNFQDVVLGRQAFLNCAPLHGLSKGCNGGEPLDVYHYMARHGLPDEGCVPYSATDHTRFSKKKKKGAANEDEDEEGDDDAAAPVEEDAAPTAAATLRALRGGDDDGDSSSSSSSGGGVANDAPPPLPPPSSAGYLERGDPKCSGPKRGQRQCMNCMPLPDAGGGDEGDEDDDGPIPAECWAVDRPIRYGLRAFGKVAPGGEASIQREILARGPVVCGIACPEAFVYGYRSGVWVDDGADKELDHDVEVVGWGEEEEVAANGTTITRKYWTIRNSWGSFWGELGFFKLERGANALQIESGEDGTGDCWWAEPDVRMEDAVAEGGAWDGGMHGLRRRRKEPERDGSTGGRRRAIDEGLVSTAAV